MSYPFDSDAETNFSRNQGSRSSAPNSNEDEDVGMEDRSQNGGGDPGYAGPQGSSRESKTDPNSKKGGGRGGSNKGNDSTEYKRRLDSESEPLDNEYYNFLHVSRDATPEQITAAYKKLSRMYHPDKHLDEQKKRQAETMFAKLKNAYEVLNDPHKRAIYDCLGKKGLQEQGWEIVQRTRTPQEIREEYDRLAKSRAERRLQQRTNPTSKLQMTINATDLFERYMYDEGLDEYIEQTIPTLEVSEISFSQTIEIPITNSDTTILSGDVSTHDGTGSGSVGCSLKRVTSEKSWHEFKTRYCKVFGEGGYVR